MTQTTVRPWQRFYDEARYAYPRSEELSEIRISVARAFGSEYTLPRPFVVGYERVLLRWMKPDASGRLVPR